MIYNIAMIPYTNMAPYWELDQPVGCRFMPCVPSKSVTSLQKGSVIAAAVPVGGLLALRGLVEPVGRFGIAAKKESMSVLFFSEQKFSEINRDSTVYLTNESESSVRLLYLLFGYYQGFDSIPCQTNNKEKANGELIIGDAALLKARSWKDKACYDVQNKTKYNHVTDLAVEWYSAFKLPFVFARWVIRKDAPGKVRSSLENWLAEFQEREQELIATSIPKTAKRLGLSNNQMMRYFSILRRTLDNEDINGQKLFLQEIQKYVQNAIFSV